MIAARRGDRGVVFGGVADQGDHDDADKELADAERPQGRLQRAHEDFGLNRRENCASGQQHHGRPGGKPHEIFTLRCWAKQIALHREGVHEVPEVDNDQNDRAPKAQPIDGRRTRGKAAVQRQIEDRRHHQRDDG